MVIFRAIRSAAMTAVSVADIAEVERRAGAGGTAVEPDAVRRTGKQLGVRLFGVHRGGRPADVHLVRRHLTTAVLVRDGEIAEVGEQLAAVPAGNRFRMNLDTPDRQRPVPRAHQHAVRCPRDGFQLVRQPGDGQGVVTGWWCSCR